MKRKFSKILGIGLSLALMVSLLLTAVPVLASSVDQLDADTSPDEISVAGTYTISYRADKVQTTGDTITVLFPDDTDVTSAAVDNTTGVVFTSGFGTNASNATTVVVVADKDDRTVIITLTALGNDIGVMSDVQIIITNVTNPTEPGDYTLQLKTSDSTTYTTSTSYVIEVPTVGGFVYVYNPSNILMATFGGSTALNDASGYYGDEGFTIKVGPGTYVLNSDFSLSGKNLTFESADGAADTIIDANDTNTISITTAKGITIDGFTIDDADIAIIINAEDATVTNNVITDATVAGIQIEIGALDATVSNNVLEDNAIGIYFTAISATDMDDIDITGNTITETSGLGGIVFGGGSEDVDVTGNTITGNDYSGIYFADASPNVIINDVTIRENTISNNDGSGIYIAGDENAITKLAITQNDILDNGDDGIFAVMWDGASSYIMFNNITGNDDDSVDNNDGDTGDEINARFNWWGSTDDADFDEEGNVDVEPWLMSTQESAVSGSKVAVSDDATSALDAKTAADVKVSGVDDGTHKADIISAAKYAANPKDALDDAIAFYDVFILLNTDFDTTDINVRLKFYDSAITTGSTANYWTGDFWAEASEQEARNGIIYVTVSDDTLPALDELEETMFGVVGGEAVTEFSAPMLIAPDGGAADISLTPTFAWTGVAGADGYYFQFADNANFVIPLAKLDGDLGRLIVTAYAYVEELPYSTAYYWRVKAVSGTISAGDLDESDWVSSVFITMDEPVEPADIILEPADIVLEQPDIIIEIPDVIVSIPAETPITPGWIYVIIAVGGVLVIALIVLIVRTRRVA